MSDVREANLIAHINRKSWWHVPPRNPRAYGRRGKFYASSFHEAEFYGRPLDDPDRVAIQNPIVGDEPSVHVALFGRPIECLDDDHPGRVLEWRWRLDARMKEAALKRGYDAIVIVTARALKRYRTEGKIPRSIELNVLSPTA
ncbi:MAG: hypothetical protein HYZ91_00745 [Candidatus Omnitrophica bacterium]|nr:hypothetical protein [Candidatus Omnitrophota bacterium]